MDTTKELKYILAYMSKSLGFTDPNSMHLMKVNNSFLKVFSIVR